MTSIVYINLWHQFITSIYYVIITSVHDIVTWHTDILKQKQEIIHFHAALKKVATSAHTIFFVNFGQLQNITNSMFVTNAEQSDPISQLNTLIDLSWHCC